MLREKETWLRLRPLPTPAHFSGLFVPIEIEVAAILWRVTHNKALYVKTCQQTTVLSTRELMSGGPEEDTRASTCTCSSSGSSVQCELWSLPKSKFADFL